MKQAVIISAVRTPMGSLGGSLSLLPATKLGSIVIAEAMRRVNLKGDQVEEIIMGNVLSAALGQAPARQACLGAGLPRSVGCTTVNKVCGSGLKAVMLAAQAVRLGDAEVVVAGGMESMSNAPYLLMKARSGYRLGHGTLVDSLIKDGLWDVYNDFHMGAAAELCAEGFRISREEQDQFAMVSYQRAQAAERRGEFKKEIVPVTIPQRGNGEPIIDADEEVKKFDLKKLKTLRAVFKEGGTVTAGNASSISDGAAAVVVVSEERALKLASEPLARIAGYSAVACDPEWFTIAPVKAISSLMQKSGWTLGDVDLFEINEAFAASSIAVNRELGLKREQVNIRGGAVALGHPIGASGARILTTLIHALTDLGKKRGVAALCIGGGEAVAMAVERV
ncbi:MAG: thiolase family protein [Candidatus Binatia bacterium]